MTRLKAVVVGLGKVGSRFDEDPGRKVPWSHVGAYLHLTDRFELAGACDPDSANREAFSQRCPGVPVWADLDEMLAATRPDVASVCTPTATHPAVVEKVLETHPIRALWCEKPLADSLDKAAAMVAACRARNLPMVVSYNRRWLPLWRRMRSLMDEGAIGTVRSVRVAFPNRLLSVGSHAVDLLLYLGGVPTGVAGLPIPALAEDGEPAVAGLVGFENGAAGIVQVTGWRNRLVVEAEAIGDEGRLWAREDRSSLLRERFCDSTRYGGYRELGEAVEEHFPGTVDHSAFVAMAEEIHGLATGTQTRESCSGASALAVQRILEALSGFAPCPLQED